MRRIILGLLAALLTFGLGAWLVGTNTSPRVVPSSSSLTISSPDRPLMTYERELFSSPSQATDWFNELLQTATEYSELAPCFDPGGRRIGERAVMFFHPPHSLEPTWRIIWTRRAENCSEGFVIQSVSLSDARHFEAVELEGFKRCASNKDKD